MKSKLTFLSEDGAGFVVDLERRKEPGKTPFKVDVSILKPKELPTHQEDGETVFMEIALSVIDNMRNTPDTFEVNMEGFEMYAVDADTPEDIINAPGFMMGGGGEA